MQVVAKSILKCLTTIVPIVEVAFVFGIYHPLHVTLLQNHIGFKTGKPPLRALPHAHVVVRIAHGAPPPFE